MLKSRECANCLITNSLEVFELKISEIIAHPLIYFLELKTIEPFVDADWYRKRYASFLAEKQISPVLHYALYGWREGLDPSKAFSTSAYLSQYKDVKAWGGNPLLHYAKWGQFEGRSPLGDARVCELIYKDSQKIDWPIPENTDEVWLSVVVPTFNTPVNYLDDLLESYLSQDFPGTELIICDDASTDSATRKWLSEHASKKLFRFVQREENAGISAALNDGVSQAKGKWITFLDHDDLIAPNAFKVIFDALKQNPDCEFAYTDEVIVGAGNTISGVFWKPAYDPVLLTGMNYINHFSVFRRAKLLTTGSFDSQLDGSQDYDFLLRYLRDLKDEQVIHIPYPAYWWRRTENTYSQKHFEQTVRNARLALMNSSDKFKTPFRLVAAQDQKFHKIEFHPEKNKWPRISVVIPNRNSFELISVLLKGLFEKTDYPDFEVLIVDNGSDDVRTIELYENYDNKFDNFRYQINEEPFNFSRSVNKGVALAGSNDVLLLNSDIEIITEGWLKEMVSCLIYENVGIVGAKLLYKDGTIQHAGVIAGLGGYAGHWYNNEPANVGGQMNRLMVRNSLLCVTGAAMLISRDCLEKTGKFDEQNFAIAYNDIDFCIRAHKLGYRIVWTPFAEMFHLESATRGSDETEENKSRFEREKANLQELHNTQNLIDPALNPYLSRSHAAPFGKYVQFVRGSRNWDIMN